MDAVLNQEELPMQCENCQGRGWFVGEGEHGAHIKRCERCNANTTDDAVVRTVAEHAMAWEKDHQAWDEMLSSPGPHKKFIR